MMMVIEGCSGRRCSKIRKKVTSCRARAAFANCVGRIRDVGRANVAYRQIWLFTVYDKDESADLGADEKRALKKAIQTELAARGRKRWPRNETCTMN
jgi:hypothetical protein